jgi:hypothetical protein
MNKPPIGKRWQPGQSGNPRGRPPDITLSHDLVADVANMLVSGTFEDVRKIAKSKKYPPLVTIIARALVKSVRRGEIYTLDRVLKWIIGKPR